jgi:hypothetical protein
MMFQNLNPDTSIADPMMKLIFYFSTVAPEGAIPYVQLTQCVYVLGAVGEKKIPWSAR